MKELYAEIERVLPDGGAWCSVERAATLASIVVALRPRIICEIGVWLGGSLIPMLLAAKHIGAGRAIAIDPWSPEASAADQDDVNAQWWKNADHDAAYRKFMARLKLHDLEHLCSICRMPSDQYEPTHDIDLLSLDGNHGPQAVRDIERFASRVTLGGILALDDIGWSGDHVYRAQRRAVELGFRDLYQLGSGVVMQRRRIGT